VEVGRGGGQGGGGEKRIKPNLPPGNQMGKRTRLIAGISKQGGGNRKGKKWGFRVVRKVGEKRESSKQKGE